MSTFFSYLFKNFLIFLRINHIIKILGGGKVSNLGNKEIMAKNIQFYMDKYGKSRQDMCEALGVKYTTFTDWVKGNSYPRIDKIELINDKDAILMSKKLAQKLGLCVGISSGANFLASVMQNKDNVVTVFPDNAFKYLSTDLTKNINYNENSIVNEIELISIENIN